MLVVASVISFFVDVFRHATSSCRSQIGARRPTLTPGDITACVFTLLLDTGRASASLRDLLSLAFSHQGFNRSGLRMESGCAELQDPVG